MKVYKVVWKTINQVSASIYELEQREQLFQDQKEAKSFADKYQKAAVDLNLGNYLTVELQETELR
jgi:hypothetical protein